MILSDLTFPPSQGLHEQSLETAKLLARLCDEFQLIIYCKDLSSVDRSSLVREFPDGSSITIIPYTGSHLRRGCSNLIFGKLRSTERQIASQVGRFNPDFIHLEMAVAAGLHRVFRSIPGVISWVDPGSRRQFRFALAARGVARLRHSGAFLLFYAFEILCRSKNKVWHLVSPDDLRYMACAHPGQRIVQIPVSLTSINGSDESVEFERRPDESLVMNALIFMDLRVPHLRFSFDMLVKRCLLPLHAEGLKIHYRVLGRVECDASLRSVCDSLDIEFLAWVDNLSGMILSSDFVLLPDQVGTGLKTRAVHVLAAGSAVIGSRYAFEGIAIRPGVDVLAANSWAEWQEGVRRLATDKQLREMLRAASPDAAAPFQAETVLKRWETLYTSIFRKSIGS